MPEFSWKMSLKQGLKCWHYFKPQAVKMRGKSSETKGRFQYCRRQEGGAGLSGVWQLCSLDTWYFSRRFSRRNYTSEPSWEEKKEAELVCLASNGQSSPTGARLVELSDFIIHAVRSHPRSQVPCALPFTMCTAFHRVHHISPIHCISSCELHFILWTAFHPVHCLSSCALHFIVFATFPHVHCLSSCALPLILCTAFHRVHHISSCALPFILCTAFHYAHCISFCALYSFLCTAFHPVHCLSSCRLHFILCIVFHHVHCLSPCALCKYDLYRPNCALVY